MISDTLTPDRDFEIAYLNPKVVVARDEWVVLTPCTILTAENDIVW